MADNLFYCVWCGAKLPSSKRYDAITCNDIHKMRYLNEKRRRKRIYERDALKRK